MFDHHRPAGGRPPSIDAANVITSDDGSLVTLMLRIIAERELEVTPLEATVFALGIHEDTGSLTFPTTTVRDVEALAFCMRRGANQLVIERFLHNPLSAPQRELLLRVLEGARPVEARGLDVLVAALTGAEYVEGVSLVVHKAMDVANCDALVLLVEMEERVFVTARSRVAALDVSEVLKSVGGGGHAAAASAIVKDVSLSTARRRVVAALKRARASAPDGGQPHVAAGPLGDGRHDRRRGARHLRAARIRRPVGRRRRSSRGLGLAARSRPGRAPQAQSCSGQGGDDDLGDRGVGRRPRSTR